MLLSMTGFGEAHHQEDGFSIKIEVRSINSRYLKVTVRCGDAYSALESEIEKVLRQQVRRGTVAVSLRTDRAKSPEDYRLNLNALAGYRDQLDELSRKWNRPDSVPLEHLLLLPGVVDEDPLQLTDATRDWPLIRSTLEEALKHLGQMRADEGRAMAADLRTNCETISGELDAIERRAPIVVDGYRTRLEERVRKLLADYEISLDPSDLIREVSIFAERSDISEEIVRLRSHVEQFVGTLDLPTSSGRKLEFLTQEMVREANTIGSKANDVELARHVIEIKASTERIREMIQNVE